MYLKLAVLNNSGNVGKSTICETLLKPRLEGAEIIKVETINHDGTDDLKLSAKEFELIQNKIDEFDCAIIDIGSSNIEQFMLQMINFKGTEDDIDFFIVPVTPQYKQQVDSVTTISSLLDLGVDIDKIKFILNQADKTISVERQYGVFLSGVKELGLNTKNPPNIQASTVFNLLSDFNASFIDVLNDDRDFRALIRAADTKEERLELSNSKAVKRIVTGFNEDLNATFKALNIV